MGRKLIFDNITLEVQTLILETVNSLYDSKELKKYHYQEGKLEYRPNYISIEDSIIQEVNCCSYCKRILPTQPKTDLASQFCNPEHEKEYFIDMEATDGDDCK